MSEQYTDVDVDNEVEDLADAPGQETEAPATETKTVKPARGDLPEGYVTPIGFAKVLGERGLQKDRDGNVQSEVRPQMVYSYIRNAAKDDPFPLETVQDSNGNERQALKVDAGVAWWERKNERAEQRKANAAAKADKKEAKAKEAPAPEAEAEADAPSELEEAE